MRYYASARINGKEVGRGLASSKKLAKSLACIHALRNIAPSLYEEWKIKKRR